MAHIHTVRVYIFRALELVEARVRRVQPASDCIEAPRALGACIYNAHREAPDAINADQLQTRHSYFWQASEPRVGDPLGLFGTLSLCRSLCHKASARLADCTVRSLAQPAGHDCLFPRSHLRCSAATRRSDKTDEDNGRTYLAREARSHLNRGMSRGKRPRGGVASRSYQLIADLQALSATQIEDGP